MHEINYKYMAFILAPVINPEVVKTTTSFFALEIPGSYLNSDFFYHILTNNLTNILLDTFILTGIIYCINSKGRDTKITSIRVFFITLLPLIFLLLLPSFIGSLGILSLIRMQGVVLV